MNLLLVLNFAFEKNIIFYPKNLVGNFVSYQQTIYRNLKLNSGDNYFLLGFKFSKTFNYNYLCSNRQ